LQLLDFQKVMQENQDKSLGREIDFDFVKGLDEAEEKISIDKYGLIVLGDHFPQDDLIQFRERLLSNQELSRIPVFLAHYPSNVHQRRYIGSVYIRRRSNIDFY